MSEQNLRQVSKSLSIVNQLLPLVDEAEKQFKSARNWGFADIFLDGSSGLFSAFFKHLKLSNAKNNMDQIQYLMNCLRQELQTIVVPADYTMNLNGFGTFFDFFWDNAFVDIYMQAKIMSSLSQVRELKEKLLQLKSKLIEFSNL